MAPSRRMRQPPALSVRSTMVEATLRGDGPPSTISGMRSPNCVRTQAAVVHSLAPLTLAEVAEVGTPAARITSLGIVGEGTRRAAFPGLAGAFYGKTAAGPSLVGGRP